MTLKAFAPLLLSIALVPLSAGCRQEEPDRPAEQVSGAAGTAGERLDDAWVTTKIQSQYFADRDVKGRNIDVTTRDGVVTLAGRVDSDLARRQAVTIAQNTEGVTRVDDRLQVQPQQAGAQPTTGAGSESMPASRTGDEAITTKVQASFFRDDQLRGRDIEVNTSQSVVTLSGLVGSEQERQQATKLARGVEGVSNVEDQLRVDSSLSQGVGTGGGTTAARPAETQTKPVQPLPPSAGGQQPSQPAQPGQAMAPSADNASLAAKVHGKYYLDEQMKSTSITATASDGVVTLTGTVPSQQLKERAVELARQTEGVRQVVDRLTVPQR